MILLVSTLQGALGLKLRVYGLWFRVEGFWWRVFCSAALGVVRAEVAASVGIVVIEAAMVTPSTIARP